MKTGEFPEFVNFGKDRTALRYIGGRKYYRDSGDWEVSVMWKDGKLVCSDRKGHLAHLFNQELFKCSETVWKNDNRGYLTKGYKVK